MNDPHLFFPNPDNSTRVLLQRDHKKNQSDYINASYVKVGKCLYLCLTDPGRGRWRGRKGAMKCRVVGRALRSLTLSYTQCAHVYPISYTDVDTSLQSLTLSYTQSAQVYPISYIDVDTSLQSLTLSYTQRAHVYPISYIDVDTSLQSLALSYTQIVDICPVG